MQKYILKTVTWTLAGTLVINTVGINAIDVTAKTKKTVIKVAKKSVVKVHKNKLLQKKNSKLVAGFALYGGKIYRNGNLFKGTVNGITYHNGMKATGLIAGILYKNGLKFSGTKNGLNYSKGKKAHGVVAGKLYKYGKKATGTYKGIYYVKSIPAAGVIKNIFYKKGKKATGTHKGIYYYKGKKASGIVSGVFYSNGKKATGIAKNGLLYVAGVENKGAYYYNQLWYVNTVLDHEKNKAITDYLAVKNLVEKNYTTASWVKFSEIVKVNHLVLSDVKNTTAQFIAATVAINTASQSLVKLSAGGGSANTPSASSIVGLINTEKAKTGDVAAILVKYADVLGLPTGFAALNPTIIDLAEAAIFANAVTTPSDVSTIVGAVVELETANPSPVVVGNPMDQQQAQLAVINAAKKMLHDTTGKYSYSATPVPKAKKMQTSVAPVSVQWQVNVSLNGYDVKKQFTMNVEEDPNFAAFNRAKEALLAYVNSINTKDYSDEQAAVLLVNKAKQDIGASNLTELDVKAIETTLKEGIQKLVEPDALKAYSDSLEVTIVGQKITVKYPENLSVDSKKNTSYLEVLKDYKVDARISLENALEKTDLVNVTTSFGAKGDLSKLTATSAQTILLSDLLGGTQQTLVSQINGKVSYTVDVEAIRLTTNAKVSVQAVAIKGSKEENVGNVKLTTIASPVGQDKANIVNEMIKKLPSVISISKTDQDAFGASKTAFEGLSATEKKLVGEEEKIKTFILQQEALDAYANNMSRYTVTNSSPITYISYNKDIPISNSELKVSYTSALEGFTVGGEIGFSRKLSERDCFVLNGKLITSAHFASADEFVNFSTLDIYPHKFESSGNNTIEVYYPSLEKETTIKLIYIIEKDGVVVRKGELRSMKLQSTPYKIANNELAKLTTVEGGVITLAANVDQAKINRVSQLVAYVKDQVHKDELTLRLNKVQQLWDEKLPFVVYNSIQLTNELNVIKTTLPNLSNLTSWQLSLLDKYHTDTIITLDKAVTIGDVNYAANAQIRLSAIKKALTGSTPVLTTPSTQQAEDFNLEDLKPFLQSAGYNMTIQAALVNKTTQEIQLFGKKVMVYNFNGTPKTSYISYITLNYRGTTKDNIQGVGTMTANFNSLTNTMEIKVNSNMDLTKSFKFDMMIITLSEPIKNLPQNTVIKLSEDAKIFSNEELNISSDLQPFFYSTNLILFNTLTVPLKSEGYFEVSLMSNGNVITSIENDAGFSLPLPEIKIIY